MAVISPETHPATPRAANARVCSDPDLSAFVDPKLTRRMSHVIRMGIGAAMEAVKAAGNVQPDAIITGTAYGCLEDTGIFLKKQVQQSESMLTPTAFIQSTHNTVGGQIGLLLKSNVYNNTIVHRGFSFEQALQDAMLMLDEGTAQNVLVGGVDELTDVSHALLSRFDLYKSIDADGNLVKESDGTIAGEGAGFFMLSSRKPASGIELKEVLTLYKPSTAAIVADIENLLAQHGLAKSDMDLVIDGRNGDATSDQVYALLDDMLPEVETVEFKDASGEYPTATAFALWKAAGIVATGEKKNVLIWNHQYNIHHSLFLVSAC